LNNNVYITGYTGGVLDGTAGSVDAFLAKYDSAGTIKWTKQLGSTGYDRAQCVAVDSNNNVYIAGQTGGALDGTSAGSYDAFLAKYDSAGTIVWTKQLGTTESDRAYGVVVDSNNNVYITGETYGDLDGSGNVGGNDAFLAKYSMLNTIGNAPICFPKGTPVTTNQGDIAIEKLNPDIHTIRGKKIVAIIQTNPLFTHIVSIENGALGKNVPNTTTQISKEHSVYYKGKMTRAIDLVGVCDGVIEIPYNGETLYNVLLKKHDKMMINNLICETLHPDNIMAKICGGKYNNAEQNKLCAELSKIMKDKDFKACKKLYASLK